MSKYHLFPILLILVIMIAGPVSGARYTLTGFPILTEKEYFNDITTIDFDRSVDGKAITLIHFKCPSNEYVNFTIYYDNGLTVTGSAQNNLVSLLPPTTTAYLTLGSDSKSYTFWDTNPEYDYNLAGYAMRDDNQTGFLVYHAGYGSFDDDLAVFFPVDNIQANMIYRVVISGSAEFDADISIAPFEDVARNIDKSITDTWYGAASEFVSALLQYASLIWGVFNSVFWLLRFFFIDHLLMTVLFYFTATMAYSAMYTKDIFGMMKKWWALNEKLLRFMVEMFSAAVNMITALINALKPI